jgi:hypothetical protein
MKTVYVLRFQASQLVAFRHASSTHETPQKEENEEINPQK